MKSTKLGLLFLVLTVLAFGQPAMAGSVKRTTQGITDNQILLGTHQDLSGPVAAVGRIYADTMMMRVREINAAGGIHGRKIRLIIEDTSYDPKKAVLATQKLLTKDKVFALVGTFGTPTTLMSRPLALKKGIPLIFGGTTAPELHTPTHPLSFGYFLPDDFFMRVGVDHVIKTMNLKTVGIIYQDDEYGDNVLNGAVRALKKHGMKLEAKASFKRGATDFSSQIRKLKSAGVDLLVLATALRETVGTAREIKKQGWKVQMLGSFPPYNAFTVPLGKDAVEGLIATGQNLVGYEDTASPKVKAWLKKWKTECKGLPWTSAAAAYNFISVVALGLEKAGRDLTMEKFIKGMESVAFQDIFGTPPTTFSATDHLMRRACFLAQVKNGKWVKISDWIIE